MGVGEHHIIQVQALSVQALPTTLNPGPILRPYSPPDSVSPPLPVFSPLQNIADIQLGQKALGIAYWITSGYERSSVEDEDKDANANDERERTGSEREDGRNDGKR
ncbi:hypothetical protein B0H17DRAFT_1138770 [Mycena rosella]|uniref:Uncharacterized protein n=1 Tax=Mycena rosella TaxID=1033263 RepID=A0AAD7G9C6_MYCRO|nr:hypothetical protein B0H17DRAFT_1138770 [Mycena rosella]